MLNFLYGICPTWKTWPREREKVQYYYQLYVFLRQTKAYFFPSYSHSLYLELFMRTLILTRSSPPSTFPFLFIFFVTYFSFKYNKFHSCGIQFPYHPRSQRDVQALKQATCQTVPSARPPKFPCATFSQHFSCPADSGKHWPIILHPYIVAFFKMLHD